MSKCILEYQNVSLGYDQDEVISDINLKLESGMLLPFVGPNGAGKSTLFKSMLGFLEPKKGSIVRDFGNSCPGYVPQQKHLDSMFPISVRQIVAMGLYHKKGLPGFFSSTQNTCLDSALERFGLVEHQNKTFGELSGGLKQKTLIARSLVGGAEIIFMDEPMAGLDASSEEMMLKLLIELNRQDNKTIFMAHHRLEDLSRLSDKACVVNRHRAKLCASNEVWKHLS